MNQIAVIGMSNFGYHLARRLSELGHEVLVLDNNDTHVDRIKAYVSRAVIGDATDLRTMRELEIHTMDAVVISLGSKIDASILTVLHLRELGAKKIIAKALSEDHEKVLKLIGVDQVVFPERDIGYRVAVMLQGTNVADHVPLGSNLSIIEIRPTREMIGRTLRDLNFRGKYGCQVLAINDTASKGHAFIPEAGTVIQESYLLFVMGENRNLDRLHKTD